MALVVFMWILLYKNISNFEILGPGVLESSFFWNGHLLQNTY